MTGVSLKTQAIEAALSRRQHSAWRNWRPGMTVRDLVLAEPFLHFSWTAPRTWVLNEIVTAGIGNTHWRDNLLQTAPALVSAQGDTVFATGPNALSRLAGGTAYQVKRMNAAASAPEWSNATPAMKVVTTDVTITNSSAETTILTYSVPANTLSINNVLRIIIAFDFLNNDSTQGFSFKVKYGGTTLITSGNGTVALSATALGGFIQVDLKGDGATNAQRAIGVALASRSGGVLNTGGTGTAAIDSAAAQTLLVTITLSLGSATITFNMRDYSIELLPNL